MRPVPPARLLCIALVVGVACHHAPPPEVEPVAASRPSSDDAAARARLDAARTEADRRAREATVAAASAIIGAQLYFDFDKATLLPADVSALDAKLPVLRAHAGVRIQIQGNADDQGTNEYNLALGQRRAAAAKRYLVTNGVDTDRIETVSYGEERPVCGEDNVSCWHQNRRDEFVIIAGAATLASANH